MSELVAIGVTHHRAPVSVRERVAFAASDADQFLNQMAASGLIDEGMLLSTCNRTELMASVADAAMVPVLQEKLAASRKIPMGDLDDLWTVYLGAQAIRHIFRVTSSLDAMVVGESQILGQVKDAYHRARRLGLLQHVLHRTVQRAFSVAKQVRSQTKIACLPVSVSAVAVELAEQIFGSLADKQVLLLGTGEMSRLTAEHLKTAGVTRMAVVSRGGDHATEFIEAFGASLHSIDAVPQVLASSDIVIAATQSEAPVITRAIADEAMRLRKSPIFCIDIAMPRNIDPTVNHVEGLYLYNLDDLKKVAAVNQSSRALEAEKAEQMITNAVSEFVSELKLMQVVPAIASLHRKCEDIRKSEVEKALAKVPAASPEVKELVDACTQAIVAKILHQPVVNLKETHVEAPEDQRSPALDFFRRLFGLEA